jgi:glutathione S-transferase
MSTSLTLIGAPFSTFTRTVRMALCHLNVEYTLEQTFPHSKSAYKYNPFGRIPSLLHGDKVIFESSAIREYIDATFDASLTPTDLETRLQVQQMISVLSDYVFHHVVFGVAKPRAKYESENKPEAEITALLEKPLKIAGRIIGAVDSMVSIQGPFLCGSQLTWADYFVYPAMADLYALPECAYLQEKGPKLYQWYNQFKHRSEVIDTFPDTFADMRSKKSNL